MAVRTVLRIGDPRLRQVSEPVTSFDTPELHALIGDMFDTMAAKDGAGLAAPQIGVLKRIMIFGVESTPRYPDVEAVPTTVLINPEYTVVHDAVQGVWEGCLSVPGMRGYVERPAGIRYSGLDQFGNGRAGNNGAGVNNELQSGKPRAPGQVWHRYAFLNAPPRQLNNPLFLLVSDDTVQNAWVGLQRQTQSTQHQVQRFIPGIIGAVTVENVCCFKTVPSPAHAIADGIQLLPDMLLLIHLRSLTRAGKLP